MAKHLITFPIKGGRVVSLVLHDFCKTRGDKRTAQCRSIHLGRRSSTRGFIRLA